MLICSAWSKIVYFHPFSEKFRIYLHIFSRFSSDINEWILTIPLENDLSLTNLTLQLDIRRMLKSGCHLDVEVMIDERQGSKRSGILQQVAISSETSPCLLAGKWLISWDKMRGSMGCRDWRHSLSSVSDKIW